MGQFFRFQFPKCILAQNLHINALELLTVLVAMRLWSKSFSNMKICLFCDNMASVTTLNSGRTRDPFMLKILREIAFLCAKENAQIRGIHLSGVNNRLADHLSRSHLNQREEIASMVPHDWQEVIVGDSMFYFDEYW